MIVRPYIAASGAIDDSIMAAIIKAHMIRNDGSDMPIVPGIPHKPMSIWTTQRTVTAQQAAPRTWMVADDRLELVAGTAGVGVSPPN